MKVEQVRRLNSFPQYNKGIKRTAYKSAQNPNLSFGASKIATNPAIFHQWGAVFADLKNKYPQLINNDYQRDFINYIKESGIAIEHPIAKHMELNKAQSLKHILEPIKTEENLKTKKHAFDFLKEHLCFLNALEGYNQFLFLANAQYSPQQEFLEFVNNNYDRLSQNKSFIKYLDFLYINIHSKEEQTTLYKNFIETIMSKYEDDSFKNLDLGKYLHAINNETAAQYVLDMLPARFNNNDRPFFLDWYFINGIKTPKQKEAAINLYNKVIELRTKDPDFRLNISPRDMILVLNFDENLSPEELLTIDERYANSRKNPPIDKDRDFLNRLLRAYSRVQGQNKVKTNYNQYNRKFLNYIMEQEPFESDEKYSEYFMSKEFMETISTEEQYNKACATYQACRADFEHFPKLLAKYFPIIIGKYNMDLADIFNVEEKYRGEIPKGTNAPLWWWKIVINEYFRSIGKPEIK